MFQVVKSINEHIHDESAHNVEVASISTGIKRRATRTMEQPAQVSFVSNILG